MNGTAVLLWALSIPVVVWAAAHAYAKWRKKRAIKGIERWAGRRADEAADPKLRADLRQLQQAARAAHKEVDEEGP